MAVWTPIASAGLYGLVILLSTGCVTIVREAVARDLNENSRQPGAGVSTAEMEGEEPRTCPDDKVQHEDCRVTPCKVTCEDLKDAKH